MHKKAKQAFAKVFYQSMTGKIDDLAGHNSNDNSYMSGLLSAAIMELIRDYGHEDRSAEFLLVTFDNLLEDKATALVRPLAAQALADAKKFKACNKLTNGLSVFLQQECMAEPKPVMRKFPELFPV